jgi:alpha-glucan,water dikinase
VTKERLEGYERPIRSHPDFIPHLRDALIGDFEHFLGILRAVHAGTDLGTAIQAARYIFDNDMHRMMDYIWHHHNDGKISTVELSEKITEARRRLSRLLCGHQEKVRDLLFLDIALEDFLRIVLEKHLGPGQDPEELVDLLGSTIENLTLSDADEELLFIRKHWRRLEELPRFSGEWSLHAKAVADRMAAAVGDVVDRLVGLIQPKAEFLGEAFHADSWAIRLFSEEVLRGRPIFALSRVLRFLDPVLRKSCHMGNWQVISPGETIAEVEMAETLRSVQGRSFSRPVLLVTERVSGDEEIPVGVTAIVTPEVIDILAHLSVRARNSGVLFATCFDADLITRLHSLRGRLVKAGIQGGDVVVEESAGGEKLAVIMQTPARRVPTVPHFTAHAITIREFAEASVGGKSNHLKQLQGKLPDWVVLPASVAIPFGVFENLLREKVNADTAADFDLLLSRLEGEEGEVPAILSLLQETILRLDAPEMIVSALRKTFGESGLPWPADWNGAWTCIKKVWASKWNERAYLSRRASNIPDRDLFMAVLIQAVIEAEYSYVIHTVNPFNGARGEIYAEAVKGLGEALVGNYPGRAFSFSYHKSDGETKAISFPSKRKGLFGKGLIFRSDSNGEDLAEFAGAGLYDSFILPLPRKITVDYTTDPLIWNDSFRKEFSSRVGEIGALVEQTLGVPQDIEGVYSKGRYYVVQTRPQVGIRDDSRP